MGKEIQVVYADILKTSGVFKDCGKRFADIVPNDIGTAPKVTEGSLEQAISASLDAIAVMHDALGSSMRTHGDKLKYVHDKYRDVEDDVNDLLDRIDDPGGIQPRF
jgi:hypothetical protein